MNYVVRNKSNSNADNAATKPNVSFTGAKLDWMTAAAYDRRLKPSDFRVAFFIAQHTNQKHRGEAFPSEGLLAELVGSSTRTVRRAVKTLAKTGWLRIKRKRTFNAETQTWITRNIYSLRFNNVQRALDEITITRLHRQRSKGTPVPVSRDTSDPLTPETEHLSKRAVREEEESKRASMKLWSTPRVTEVFGAALGGEEFRYLPSWSDSALARMPNQLGYLVRLAASSTRH